MSIVPKLRQVWVPIKIDWGLAVLAAIFTFGLTTQVFPQFAPSAGLWPRIGAAVTTAAMFVASIVAHEVGHTVAARRNGISVSAITLSVYGGAALLDRHPDSPRAEFVVAAAGPATNIMLTAAFAGLAAMVRSFSIGGGLLFGALVWLASVNLLVAVVNLIPATPLDGGRLLTAALWWRGGDAETARLASSRIGLVAGVSVAVLSAVAVFRWPAEALMAVMVAAFVIRGARSEIQGAALRRRLHQTLVGDVMSSAPASLPDRFTVSETLDAIGLDHVDIVTPLLRWGHDPVAYVVPRDALELDEAQRCYTPIDRYARGPETMERVWSTETISDLLRPRRCTRPLVAVVHEPVNGHEVGTVSEGQLRALMNPPDWWGRDREQVDKLPGSNSYEYIEQF